MKPSRPWQPFRLGALCSHAWVEAMGRTHNIWVLMHKTLVWAYRVQMFFKLEGQIFGAHDIHMHGTVFFMDPVY